MNRLLKFGLPALIACAAAHAAELEIQLPEADWVLAPLDRPLLQQEAYPLIAEREMFPQIYFLVDSREYEAALDLMRETHPRVLLLLEAGDPLGLLSGVVVAADSRGFGGTEEHVSAALMYFAGHMYLALEQFLAAETAFKSALGPIPDYMRVHESIGVLYLNTQRWEEARTHLSRAAELGLNSANLWGAIGFLNQEIENFWGAVGAYQQAVMLDYENEQWRQGLLFSLAQTYQFDSTLTLVDQLLQEDGDDPELWLFRAHAALQTGNREVALTSLETAIRLGEVSPANLQVCASLHMELGSIGRATELLREGFAQGLEFDFIDQGLGWFVDNGEWGYLAEILAAMRERWDTLTDVERSRVLTREASMNLNEDDEQAAMSALDQALGLDPSNAEALITLGGIHATNRNFTEAELLFQRASAYDRYRDNALLSLAQIAVELDDFQRALELLLDVVSRNPERTDLRRNIDSLENLVLLNTEN